tara:strand:- start:843 stop:6548 length:5706 start_codon:yes stop_codon:yes gene_type:complete
MSGDPARLMPETDRLSAPAQHAPETDPMNATGDLSGADQSLLRRRAAHKTLDTKMRGLDPLTTTSPIGGPIPWQVEIERRWGLEKERNQKMNDGVFGNPESGWGQIKAGMDDIFKRYKERNEEALIKKPNNEEEAMAQMQQMQPVSVDPNDLANLRQMAVKLDQMMKAIDPRTSFWTDPRTKKYADWLNREAGGGQAGFMTSGEQELNIGAVGTAAMAGVELIEGTADFGTNLVLGGWDLGRQGILAMNGPDMGPLMPTNYIEGDDGKLYDNSAKAPAFLESTAMMWAAATDQNVSKFASEFGRTRELEVASRNGFQTVVLGASRIAGMGAGFGLPAGLAMKGGAKLFGGLTSKGLQGLGTLRLGKGLKESERALKIIKTMGSGLGAAVGNGMAESAAYGRVDGYGKSFMHGMAMAPVLMGIGHMGRKTEWLLKNRTKMPKMAATAIGQAMEGVGFGAMESHFPELLPAAWGFMKNPNEDTWETYAKNVAGFMMFSIASRGRSVNPAQAPARAQMDARVSRRRAGEQAAQEGAQGPEAEVGQMSRATRSADPATRQRATEQLKQRETETDVQELGLEGPNERTVRDAGETLAEPSTRDITVRKGLSETEGKALEASQMEGLRTKLKEAKSMGERKAIINEMRVAEQRSASSGDRVELGEGQGLEFTEGQGGVSEWRVRGKDGELIGGGSFTAKGGKAEIHNAEIVEAHRGKGIYTKVVEQLKQRYPEGLESVHQEPGAKRAHEKAGESLLRPDERKRLMEEENMTSAEVDTWEAEIRGGDVGGDELEVRRKDFASKAGERSGPQSLQVPPTRQVEPSANVKPVRASDIELEMEGRSGSKGIRIPLTSIRVGGKKPDAVRVASRSGKLGGPALGHFKFFENMMRSREGRDLVVQSHEWSHAMHRHTAGKRGKDFMPAAKEQYKKLPDDVIIEIDTILKDYPGQEKLPKAVRWMEAWAEWNARNLLGEVGLGQKLPALTKYFQEWLAQPEQAHMRIQYNRIQDMLARYNAQGSLGRVRQSIVLKTDKPTESQLAGIGPVVRAYRKLRTGITKAMVDDMIELKQTQDKHLEMAGVKPEDVPINEDPARMFDALRMTAGKTAERFVTDGIRLPGGQKIPGLKQVLEPATKNSEAFYSYVVARRNLELFRKGKSVQLPPQDYAEAIKQLEELHPEFRKAADGIKLWTDALVDYVARSGGMNEANAQRIKDSSALYVPFFRAMEGPGKSAGNRGVAEKGTGLMKIKGSTLEIRDPLVALQEVAASMVAKAHQNQVMTALYKMALTHEAGGLATIVPRSKVPSDHPVAMMLDMIEKKIEVPEELRDHVGEIFDVLRDLDAVDPQIITTFAQKVIPTGERAIVAYTPHLTPEEMQRITSQGTHGAKNERLIWLELDTKAYEAMMGIDKMPHLPENLQGIMKLLQAPRDLVRFFATGVSPGFVAANAIRDALSEPLFSRQGKFRPFGGLINIVRGAIEYHKNGEMRELYEELGVKTSSFLNEGRQREIAGQKAGGLWEQFKRPFKKMEEVMSHPENYLRMAKFKDAYNAAIKSGKTEEVARLEALEEGKELMNFARAGVVSRILNQMIPYFNAGIQGKRKFWSQLVAGGDAKGDAAKARVQRGTILNGLAQITVPTMLLAYLNKDEEWYHDLPQWRKTHYWNTKIGDDIISIPKPFEAGAIFGTAPEMVFDRFLQQANPVEMQEFLKVAAGSYMEGLGSFMPAFLRPLVEVGTNYDFFKGRPITPDWIARSQKPSEQSTFYTTATARIISKAFNGVMTPIEIEQFLGSSTAGAGVSAMRMADQMFGMKDHPLMDGGWGAIMKSASGADRFTKQTEHGQSAAVTDLYELSKDLDQRSDELTSKEQRLRKKVNAVKRDISDLRKKQRAGRMTRSQAERRAFELAKPLVQETR